MNCSLVGPFVAFDAGNATWRLSSAAPAGAGGSSGVRSGVQILLRGASASAAQIFADAPHIERVVLDWSRDIVIVTLTVEGGSAALTARSAIVHEPRQDIYRYLPLAEFDAAARAFWQRVFRLLRIPGGRFLLGVMTRRGRRRR